MLGKSITLFELLGFKIKVDVSWAFLAVLIAWSLSQGYFPGIYSGLPKATYWWMGLAGMFGLFLSIVLHELAHSLVARAYGMKIRGITLWLLGGVAEMADEPPTPTAEFVMAIAGPLMSILLAFVFFGLAQVVSQTSGESAIVAVLEYLVLLNGMVAVFNLIPAFPMDGGRMLRAILWGIKRDFNWATRQASRAGALFGMFVILLGVFSVLWTGTMHGLWWVMLGMFIRFAADAAYQRVEETRTLEGMTVADVMADHPVSVSPDLGIQQFVDDYLFRYQHDVFPVVRDGKLEGVIDTSTVRELQRHAWYVTTVGELMRPISDTSSIDVRAAVGSVLQKMRTEGVTRLVVTDGGELRGMLALKDILSLVTLKGEFASAK